MRLIIIVLFCITIISCKKEGCITDPCVMQNYDSATTASRLIGTWKWKTGQCQLSGTRNADKNVIATFTNNNLIITEDGVQITNGTWGLEKDSESNIWKLTRSSFSGYVEGYVGFCENKAVFANMYVDGCDNLFEKQ